MRLTQCDKSLKMILRPILKFIFFYHLNWISPHSINKLSKKKEKGFALDLFRVHHNYMPVHLVGSGFSIEGGTRRLIAAYFGIYSHLLCV